jgi:hypothetical protein
LLRRSPTWLPLCAATSSDWFVLACVLTILSLCPHWIGDCP